MLYIRYINDDELYYTECGGKWRIITMGTGRKLKTKRKCKRKNSIEGIFT
jgi:hypothetical protein